jgi:hypothetical protein
VKSRATEDTGEAAKQADTFMARINPEHRNEQAMRQALLTSATDEKLLPVCFVCPV